MQSLYNGASISGFVGFSAWERKPSIIPTGGRTAGFRQQLRPSMEEVKLAVGKRWWVLTTVAWN